MNLTVMFCGCTLIHAGTSTEVYGLPFICPPTHPAFPPWCWVLSRAVHDSLPAGGCLSLRVESLLADGLHLQLDTHTINHKHHNLPATLLNDKSHSSNWEDVIVIVCLLILKDVCTGNRDNWIKVVEANCFTLYFFPFVAWIYIQAAVHTLCTLVKFTVYGTDCTMCSASKHKAICHSFFPSYFSSQTLFRLYFKLHGLVQACMCKKTQMYVMNE